ncbi:MAG: PQQ-binding-like beta-propeller repeat protein, partial [Ardenticatenales bacterium]|nr:PQQ-binding-like beta-propeller repeat protein [Ardenticatenales bacterium]
IPDSALFELRSRERTATGTIEEIVTLLVRGPRGDQIIGFYYPQTASEILFTPPLLDTPATLEVGSRWESRGQLSTGATYSATGQILSSAPIEHALGISEDCLQVDFTLTARVGRAQPVSDRWQSWYCAGQGVVDAAYLDGEGNLVNRTRLLSLSSFSAPVSEATLPPTVAPGKDAALERGPMDWQLSRLGRARPTGEVAASTIPPTWISTEPPLLLAAAHEGDLVAYEAHEEGGRVLWRFHPGGTIYGPPAFDARHGRLYFGASDKHLYALDSQGLFLWAFRSGDNVATRPLVVGDMLIFGSEDRAIYGLDAQSGALRWRVETGGPVVSSPALMNGIVAIGSDDGAVYGLDPATGEQRWLHATGDAVEAPIVAADGLFYAASRDGTLYVLDATTGKVHWEARAGHVLRDAPALTDERVYLVAFDGRLLALARASGRRLWSSAEQRYVGSPVVVGETLILASTNGSVYELDAEGRELARWEASEARAVTDSGESNFAFGPTVGGGALWLADDEGVLFRLGAPAQAAGLVALDLAWAVSALQPPFAQKFVSNSAVAYGEQALLLDTEGHLFLLDPATGMGNRIGALAGDVSPSYQAPLLVGDTLLVLAGDTLHAVQLPEGQARWRFQAEGVSNFPGTVAGDMLLLLAGKEAFSESQQGEGTLYALDLATGEPRWQAPLQGLGTPGGVVVAGDS